jgi:hypothetical protein
MGVKASLDSATSKEERALILQQTRWPIALVAGFLVIMGLATPFAANHWNTHRAAGTILLVGLPLLYAAALLAMIFRFKRALDRVRKETDAQLSPEAAARRAAMWKTTEYKSKWTLLGLPLVHVRTGRPRTEPLRPAVGWIAIGDFSIGLISVGGIALGGISLGGISAGLLSLGGVALGAIACGGVSIGAWIAAGGLAIGWLAEGGCALAWHGAMGGMAVAHDFALGGSASALHANDDAARHALESVSVLRAVDALMRNSVLINLIWLPMVLIIWQARRARLARLRATDSR